MVHKSRNGDKVCWAVAVACPGSEPMPLSNETDVSGLEPALSEDVTDGHRVGLVYT